MTQEALKLALEALEMYQGKSSVQMFDAAITALREALAQPEQEPVAMWDGKYQIEFGNLSAYKHGEHSWIPLYTTPPQEQQSCDKRTWVGLTNNELQPIADEYRILFGGWVEDFARAIEARLKEKNETL